MENDNDDIDDKTDFKQNLTGYVYQLKLLLLFLWRGLKSGSCNKFQLGTELKEAEKFDDAIFFYEKSAKTFVRYLQAKYRRFVEKKLKFKDFVSEWNQARCNLKKYFISFRKIKQRPYMIYQAELDDLIICTNIPFGQLKLKKNASDILTFRDVTGETHDEIFEGMKKYQLMAVSSSPKLYEMLKLCSNLNLLAEKLIICIFNDINILDLQDYWISGYFNVLIKEKVIEQREKYYKLSMEDPNYGEQKNKDIRDFRQHFMEKRMQIDGIRHDNVMFSKNFIDKLNGQSGSVSATLEETAEILVEHATKNIEVVPPHSTNMIFDKLYDLVKCEQSFFFTENFIHDSNDLSQNAKYFRKLMMEVCEKEVAKNLVGQEIYAVDALKGIMNYAWSAWSNNQKADEEKIAKDLIQHIFYKKELTNIFKPEYSFLKDAFSLTGMNTLQFTKDFAKNNNGNFRKIFLKLYAEEKVKNTAIKFKQNLKKYSTIIEQLKKSYNNARKNKIKVLKFDQNKMEGLIEALNGSIFIATPERNRIEFADIFTDIPFTNQLAENFKLNLKSKFSKDFEKLKDYKIEYINYPPHFGQLTEESTPINKDIETFRQKLFIVNTPSETELMKNISVEMGEKFNLLDEDTITFSVFQDVMNWAKEKEDKLLDTSEVSKYLSKVEAKISEKFEVGCSLQYMSKLEEYSITYNNILFELLNFLGLPPFEANRQRVLHIQTNEKLLMAIKVCQTIKSSANFKNKDYFIFNPVASLIRMEKCDKHVSKAFGSTTDILIIFEKEETKGSQEFCNVLNEIISNNPKKKIIIISNETSQLISALKALITQQFIDTITKKIMFNELTPKSKNIILQNNIINFQGNNVLLLKLMNDKKEASMLLDSYTLEKIIKGEKIAIGECVETCAEIENDTYRPRQLRLIEIDDTLFEKKGLPERHLFAVEGIPTQKFLERKNITESIINAHDFLLSKSDLSKVFIILEGSQAKTQFDQICKKYPYCSIHWLKWGSEKLIWFYSQLSSLTMHWAELERHICRKEEYVHESFFGSYITQNQMVVIADTAGMGKSTILTKFLKTLKIENQWVIRINLNQYTPILLKIKQSSFRNDKKLYLNFNNFNLEKKKDYGKLILESLITPESNENKELTFENQIFNHFFTKRGILFMFDGYDEINPDYGNIVLHLLQMLKKNERNRIWITSRTNFKQTLEKTFNTFAYDMKPFDRNDQQIFLKQYWINNYKKEKGKEMPNQDRLSFYVDTILNAAHQSIGDIIGIPLQTKMLAEIFQQRNEDEKFWITCNEYIESEIPMVDLKDFVKLDNIFILYEKFFKEKIYKYFLQEKGIVELSKPFANKIKKDVFVAEYSSHKILGYITLIPANEQEALLTENEKQLKNDWLVAFDSGVENIGIINGFNSNGCPLFTHFTYAEYLTACCLVDKLCISPSNAIEVFKVANEIFKKEVPVFVECFLYKLKQESDNKELKIGINGESILKFVIEHGLINCVYVFLSYIDFNGGFPENDESSQNIIYYAADSGRIDVVAFIMFYIFTLIKVPDLFLHYVSNILFQNNRYSFASNANPEIKYIFGNIKKSVERCVIYKENPDVKSIINKTFSSQVKNNISNALEAIKTDVKEKTLLEFLKFFSGDHILVILQVFKVSGHSLIINFVNDICSRNDMNEREKMRIFETIKKGDAVRRNQFISFLEHRTQMIMLVVRNDCPNLLEEMLSSVVLKYNEIELFKCFQLACRFDYLQIIKKLLPHLLCKQLSLPLFNAIEHQTSLETIKFLYETTEATIHDVNKDDETFLFAAVRCKCNIKTIDYLCEKGADPNKYNIRGDSPWTMAVKKGNDEIIKYFLLKFSNLHFINMVEILNKYYKDVKNFNLNQTVNGQPLLYLAISEKNVVFTKFLIEKGADVRLKNSNGLSPINLAHKINSDGIIKLLIAHGASYHELYLAVRSIFTNEKFPANEMCSTYKTSGVINKNTINIKDDNGNTFLHVAARDYDEKTVIHLLKLGAYYNSENIKGETPELVATPTSKSLLNKINKCFHDAKDNDFNALVKYFCNPESERNSKISSYPFNIKNESSKTQDNINFLNIFQNFNETKHFSHICNVKHVKGKTLLHYAVKNNNLEAVEVLLTNGADINETDNKKRTPVYYAIKNNCVEVFKLLLRKSKIHIQALFSANNYMKIEPNECNMMISCIAKCQTHLFNQEIKELKHELELVKSNHNFDFIVSVESTQMASVSRHAVKYSDLLLYLLQNGVVVQTLQFDVDSGRFQRDVNRINFKISSILLILIKTAEYVLSKNYTPESIINFYNWHFTEALSYITANQHDADKVIANVRFEFENIQGATLLHIAAIVDDEKIAEWLIKEKNADPYLKDHNDNNVFDLAKKHKSHKVLSLLEKIKKNNNLKTPS